MKRHDKNILMYNNDIEEEEVRSNFGVMPIVSHHIWDGTHHAYDIREKQWWWFRECH